MSADKKRSFLNGAFILGAAGLICKIIGAVYKIPLRNIVGAETMGIYSAVYPIYTFLLIFSTSGIPTAISKLVSERSSVGDYKGAHEVFRTSMKLLLWLGGITSFLMAAGSQLIANAMSISDWKPVAAIAPALFFVSVLSAYRGYYQGMQNMKPTAITQLVEQLFKLIFGFWFAITWYKRYQSPVLGATGALLGITVSEIAAFALIFFVYQKSKGFLAHRQRSSVNCEEFSAKNMTKRFFQIAVPITIGAAVKPLVDAIDSFMVLSILTGEKIGFEPSLAKTLYGFLKSDCGTLVNLPAVLTTALSMALVPAISNAVIRGEKEVRKISATGLKLSLLIGLPCTIGFFTMAREILSLLYRYSTEEHIASATTFLQILAFGVLFLAVIQTSAGILQGLGKATIPVLTLAFGMAVKIAMNFILVTNPNVNIIGVPLGTVTCYGIAAVLDVLFVIQETGLKFRFSEMLLRPLLSSGVMLAFILLARKLLAAHLGSRLVSVAIIGAAALLYAVSLIVFNVFNENDLELMPGGGKIRKVLEKLGRKIRTLE